MYIIKVRGTVQGVGFRPSVKRAANRLGARGFVKNDGSHVTIWVEEKPDRLIELIGEELGPMADIENMSIVEASWEEEGLNSPEGFRIIASGFGELDSSFPPDAAICERCIEELLDREDRRYLYPFTNCTNCGARYSLIRRLPYDRDRTTMRNFPLCGRCSEEYLNEDDRRLHAQTISCPEDGPVFTYMDRLFSEVCRDYDAFMECARGIKDGKRIVIKGWGGMHIACSPEALPEMRKWYKRPFKPFALMFRDPETVEELIGLDGFERRVLESSARPITLVRSKDRTTEIGTSIFYNAAPGLDSVGVFLPYSGAHHVLFKALDEVGFDNGCLVMTSANLPGEPILTRNCEAFTLKADGYLLHNREIAAMCDDSVVVPLPGFGEGEVEEDRRISHRAIIRKARGYIPDPIKIDSAGSYLSLGAERNSTITVTRGEKAFTSPYLGNTSHPGVARKIPETIDRFKGLFGIDRFDAIACDLHPSFLTSRLGASLSREMDIPLIRVQHHHAHGASLLMDSGLDSISMLAIDGVGLGSDDTPWGGECLHVSRDSWERIGHLEPFGLPGGDSATYHPDRIAHWLSSSSGWGLPLANDRLEDILTRIHSGALRTTSMGRLLDALSALLLGITERTYDGEPAMRLERLLAESRSPEYELFNVPVRDKRVDVIERWGLLLEEMCNGGNGPTIGMGHVDHKRKANLALGFVGSVVRDMVSICISSSGDLEVPKGEGRPLVGISGGVAYNVPILREFCTSCRDLGGAYLLHDRIPPGDGGVSTGQAVVAGWQMEDQGY